MSAADPADPVAPKAAEAAGAAEASNGADGAPEPCAPAAAATEGTTTATAQVCDPTDFGQLKSLGTPRIGGFNTPYIYIVVSGLEHFLFSPTRLGMIIQSDFHIFQSG